MFFIFLGSMINDDGNCDAEIAGIVILAKVAMNGLQKIWKDKNICKQTKTRLVKALVFPISMYGCESWTMRKKHQ